MPERRAITSIERKEVPFPTTAENQVRRRAQNSTFGEVDHLVFPFLAGLRNDGYQSAVAFLFPFEVSGVSVSSGRETATSLGWMQQRVPAQFGRRPYSAPLPSKRQEPWRETVIRSASSKRKTVVFAD